jgi:hypothetical protein
MAEPNVVTEIVDLAEARRRLPKLRPRVSLLMEATRGLKSAHLRLHRSGVALGEDPARLERLTRDRRAAEERFRAALEAVNELGAYVKDPEIGLVDFYSWRGAEMVFLCWRHGEEDIVAWHGIDEGFSGRKSLDAEA